MFFIFPCLINDEKPDDGSKRSSSRHQQLPSTRRINSKLNKEVNLKFRK